VRLQTRATALAQTADRLSSTDRRPTTPTSGSSELAISDPRIGGPFATISTVRAPERHQPARPSSKGLHVSSPLANRPMIEEHPTTLEPPDAKSWASSGVIAAGGGRLPTVGVPPRLGMTAQPLPRRTPKPGEPARPADRRTRSPGSKLGQGRCIDLIGQACWYRPDRLRQARIQKAGNELQR